MEVALSPRGAQAVAKMPTTDPFASPRGRKLDMDTGESGDSSTPFIMVANHRLGAFR